MLRKPFQPRRQIFSGYALQSPTDFAGWRDLKEWCFAFLPWVFPHPLKVLVEYLVNSCKFLSLFDYFRIALDAHGLVSNITVYVYCQSHPVLLHDVIVFISL